MPSKESEHEAGQAPEDATDPETLKAEDNPRYLPPQEPAAAERASAKERVEQ